MFCTYKDYQLESRPMATAGVDDNGTIWFFSRKSSDKNEQLEHNQRWICYTWIPVNNITWRLAVLQMSYMIKRSQQTLESIEQSVV